MNTAPSRQQRRALERRQDKVMSRLRYRPLPGADHERDLYLVREPGNVAVVRGPMVPLVLLSLLAEDVTAEIDALRRPGRVPALVLVDAWASIAWIDLLPMSPGGCA